MTQYFESGWLRLAMLAIALPALSACHKSSDSDDDEEGPLIITSQYAVSANAAADFSSGAHSIIGAEPPREASNNLDGSGSDLLVAAHKDRFFRIERFMSDSIRRYDATAPGTAQWVFSTNDVTDTVSSNVHDMVFASPNKAYLIRFGSDTAWVVNPSAEQEADFKIGELDLSAYGGEDGVPEMDNAVIVGNKLFIAMQRFENGFCSIDTGYVAVFNINTDGEIDTGTDTVNGLKGIPLPVNNPRAMQYDPDTGLIYLLAGGTLENPFCGDEPIPASYSGGIVSIDPASYEVQMVVDDGDSDSHPYGNLSTLALVNGGLGYFIGYNGWQDTTLYRFDPSTGVVAGAVAGYENQDLTTLGVDGESFLWVGRVTASNPGFSVLDTITDTEDQFVSTDLNPQNISFGEIEIAAEP